MNGNSTPKDILSQVRKDFASMIKVEQPWGLRVCWGIYSIVFDAARAVILPFAAIGYAIWDAIKAAREEFGDE